MKFMKRTICVILAVCMLIPLSAVAVFAAAEIGENIAVDLHSKKAIVNKESTLYLGKVTLNGKTAFRYLYSEDLSQNEYLYGDLSDALSEFEDGAFAALMPTKAGQNDEVGIAVCSEEKNVSAMNAAWKSADAAGTAVYTTATVNQSSSVDLYETNADFAAKCSSVFTDPESDFFGAEPVDEAGAAYEQRGVIGKLSEIFTDSVTYTVIDGELWKLIDRDAEYACESVTVIYTEAELQASVVKTVSSGERIATKPTVYIGEVVVDGESIMQYGWSSDLTVTSQLLGDLQECYSGVVPDAELSMLAAMLYPYMGSKGVALCSDTTLIASMDGNWKNAAYVGGLYYPEATVLSETEGNLYDLDEMYRKGVDRRTEIRQGLVDDLVETDKRFITYTSAYSSDSVYYTTENGNPVKHVDTYVSYDCAAITVIYTKVELGSGAPAVLYGDVNGDAKINKKDSLDLKKYLADNDYEIDLTAADVNCDNKVNKKDSLILKQYLAGWEIQLGA